MTTSRPPNLPFSISKDLRSLALGVAATRLTTPQDTRLTGQSARVLWGSREAEKPRQLGGQREAAVDADPPRDEELARGRLARNQAQEVHRVDDDGRVGLAEVAGRGGEAAAPVQQVPAVPRAVL